MAQLGITCIPLSHASQCIVLYTTFDVCHRYLNRVHEACARGCDKRALRSAFARALGTVHAWELEQEREMEREVVAQQPLYERALARTLAQYRRDLEHAGAVVSDPELSVGAFIHHVLQGLASAPEVVGMAYFGPCGFAERLALVHRALSRALGAACRAAPPAPGAPREEAPRAIDVGPDDSASNHGAPAVAGVDPGDAAAAPAPRERPASVVSYTTMDVEQR